MRILRIIHSLDPNFGGPQNAIIDHTYSLIRAGIKVDILTNGFKTKDLLGDSTKNLSTEQMGDEIANQMIKIGKNNVS